MTNYKLLLFAVFFTGILFSESSHLSDPHDDFPFLKENLGLVRKVLITGCGRSGTKYISEVLCQCTSLDAPHERIGKDGSCCWYMAADPFHVHEGGHASSQAIVFYHIFHQVRHPLKVITSAMTLSDSSWKHIQAYIPEISGEDSLTVKCAKYWYYWNLKAEAFAEWRYRIEDIDTEIDHLAQLLGTAVDKQKMHTISKATNTRLHRHFFTWNELEERLPEKLYWDIVYLATKYGYPIMDVVNE